MLPAAGSISPLSTDLIDVVGETVTEPATDSTQVSKPASPGALDSTDVGKWSNITEDTGTGGWGDPNHPGWDNSAHIDSESDTTALPHPEPLPEPYQISLPETVMLPADLREDFTIENLLWSEQEWRHTHMDSLNSPAWARVQRKYSLTSNLRESYLPVVQSTSVQSKQNNWKHVIPPLPVLKLSLASRTWTSVRSEHEP